MQTVTLHDLVSSARVDKKQDAESFFERVFDSLMWTRVTGGVVEEVSPLQQWRHRQLSDIESDIAYLEINRQELLSTFSEYLSNPALTSKQADWLFLNALTYAEYIATVSDIRKKVMGIEQYVRSLFPPRSEHLIDNFSSAKRPWHLPMFVIVVAVSWAIHPFAGIAVTAFVFLNVYRQKKARGKINSIVLNMLQTYMSFNTVDVSWGQVIHTLERSRDAGAIWNSSLYALAERRIRDDSPTSQSTRTR